MPAGLLYHRSPGALLRPVFRVIGQKVLMKTAAIVGKSMVTAVISFLEQDTGWTKSVDENASAH